jgi:hypothetical protein
MEFVCLPGLEDFIPGFDHILMSFTRDAVVRQVGSNGAEKLQSRDAKAMNIQPSLVLLAKLLATLKALWAE